MPVLSKNVVLEWAKCEELEKLVIGDDNEKFSMLELNCPLKRRKADSVP